MQCRARAPDDRHSITARGGSRGEAPRKGGVELGGHEWTRNARGAHESRSPDPLACLERLDGRRSPSIMMVVMLALHQRYRACATRGAISSCDGQCMAGRGTRGALSRASVRAGGIAYRAALSGEQSLRGGRKALQAPQRRRGFFAFSVWAVLHSEDTSVYTVGSCR